MTSNYEKKLLNEIKELKEGSVPKDILFAERSAHRREIAALQKEGKWRDELVAELQKEIDIEHTRYLQEQVKNADLKEHKLNREEQLTKIADIVGYGFPNIDNNNKLIDMIEKLKEENEKLTGELYNTEQQAEGFRNEYPKLEKENEKLKDENEKLKRDIDDALESYMEVFKEE